MRDQPPDCQRATGRYGATPAGGVRPGRGPPSTRLAPGQGARPSGDGPAPRPAGSARARSVSGPASRCDRSGPWCVEPPRGAGGGPRPAGDGADAARPGRRGRSPARRACLVRVVLRKEVIQPQVPLRLPCYDLVPITGFIFGACLAAPATSDAPRFGGLTGGVYKAQEHIHRGTADPRLLAIPASCGRVAARNPNWGAVFAIGAASRLGVALSAPL